MIRTTLPAVVTLLAVNYLILHALFYAYLVYGLPPQDETAH